MASDYDTLLDEGIQNQQVTAEFAERLKAASSGSPLRKERDEAKEEAKAARERVRALEEQTLHRTFKDLGIGISPDVLKRPEDLDVTDTDAVKQWAVEHKLLEPDPAELEKAGELEELGAIASAAKGGEAAPSGLLTPEKASEMSHEQLRRLQQTNPEAFEALKRGESVPLNA